MPNPKSSKRLPQRVWSLRVPMALAIFLAVLAQPVMAAGSITEYPVPTSYSQPRGITTGPDGALWFGEFVANKIGRLTTGGAFTEYHVPTTNGEPAGIVSDGTNLWFVEYIGNKIGRLTTGGVFTEYAIPTYNSKPFWIALGSDGNLWFTEYAGNKIGKLTKTGAFTEYRLPTASPGGPRSPRRSTAPEGVRRAALATSEVELRERHRVRRSKCLRCGIAPRHF